MFLSKKCDHCENDENFEKFKWMYDKKRVETEAYNRGYEQAVRDVRLSENFGLIIHADKEKLVVKALNEILNELLSKY